MHKVVGLVLFLIGFTASAEPCVKPLSIIFYAGNRYYDGFGDLSLNKALIDQQVKDLRKKYGECVKINVGFFEERAHRQSSFQGYDANQRIYTSDTETKAFHRFVNSKSGRYRDPHSRITYWSEKALNEIASQGQYEAKFDLGIMMSELTWSVPAEKQYHLPSFAQKTNVVSFQEYEAPSELTSAVKLNDASSIMDKKFHLNVKVKAGFGNAGILIDRRSENVMNSAELKKWLGHTLENHEDKLIPQNLFSAERDVKAFLAEPKIKYLTSYLSSADDWIKAVKRAYESVLTAYYDHEHLLSRGEKPGKYVIISNQLENLQIGELHSSMFREKVDPALKSKFDSFLKDDALILTVGKKGLSVSEMRSLYDPLNGSVYSQVAGYGSLNDVLSLGGLPFPQWRRYHQLSLVGPMHDAAVRLGYSSDIQAKLVLFLVENKEFKSDSENAIGGVEGVISKRVREYHELQPYFAAIADDLRKNQNLHNYVSDTVSQFYAAKQVNPESPAEALIEKTVSNTINQLEQSPFLSSLTSPAAYAEGSRINPFQNCLKAQFLSFPLAR